MLVGLLVLVSVLGLVGGWIVLRALAAQRQLRVAQVAFEQAKSDGLAGRMGEVAAKLATAQHATATARALTSDPVWRLVDAIPGLGDTPAAVTVLAQQADVLARDVFPPLVAVSRSVEPSRLRLAGNRVDLAPLQAAVPVLARAAQDMVGVRTALADASGGWVIGAVARPLASFRSAVDGLSDTITSLGTAALLIPPMLGADGVRHYFLAFQNPAESRGTGGIVGAYGVLTADHGLLKITELGTDAQLRNLQVVPVDLGPGFAQLYGADPAFWQNSNESPYFPDAARIWLAAWQKTRGQALDGAIALDPIVLSDILRVTGPATLPDGEQISAANVVRTTLVDAYVRFAADNQARKQFLVEVSAAAVRRIFSGAGSPRALVDALGSAAAARRLLVYSAHPGEQSQLALTPLGGTLPAGPAPFLLMTTNNAAGSKLDVYLDRSLRWTGAACSVAQGTRMTTVTVTLTNAVSPTASFPDYVAGRDADPSRLKQHNANVELVGLYLTAGARLVDLTLDGVRVGFRSGTEHGHPGLLVPVDLPPDQPRTLVVTLLEPATTLAPTVLVQPLVRPQRTVVDIPRCRT